MSRAPRVLRWLGLFVVRVASIGAGILIEYRQIYGEHAQLDLIGLGLLFICVPPTLWLDTLAKVSKVADTITASAQQASEKDETEGHPFRRGEDRRGRK